MKTEKEVSKEFLSELKALLKKYNAEIEAEDHWKGYSECGRDIRMTVNIPSIYQDGEPIQEMTEINLGTFVDGKD